MFMLFALTLTTLAGLSTGLGGLVVLLFKRPRARMMAFSMGFAGGVMLTVSLSDMLPHTVETYSDTMGRFPAALASASLCVMGMLFTVGVAALIGVKIYMENKLSYFTFHWPIQITVSVMLSFAVINIFVTCLVCKEKSGKTN